MPYKQEKEKRSQWGQISVFSVPAGSSSLPDVIERPPSPSPSLQLKGWLGISGSAQEDNQKEIHLYLFSLICALSWEPLTAPEDVKPSSCNMVLCFLQASLHWSQAETQGKGEQGSLPSAASFPQKPWEMSASLCWLPLRPLGSQCQREAFSRLPTRG